MKTNIPKQVANDLKNEGPIIVQCRRCPNTYELPESFRTRHKKSIAYQWETIGI